MLATLPIQVVTKMIYHTLNGNCDYSPRDRCDEHGQNLAFDRCTDCDRCQACEAEGAADGARDDQKDDDVTR